MYCLYCKGFFCGKKMCFMIFLLLQKCVNHQFQSIVFIFLLLTGLTWYIWNLDDFHDISTTFSMIAGHRRALFKFGRKQTYLAENPFKNWVLRILWNTFSIVDTRLSVGFCPFFCTRLTLLPTPTILNECGI